MRQLLNIKCDKTNCPIFIEKHGNISPVRTELHTTTQKLEFDIDILFIAPAPATTDERYGAPLSSRDGFFLRNAFRKKFKNEEKFAYINIVRCAPPEHTTNDQIVQQTIPICPFVQLEIARMNPKLIVLLGDTVARGILKGEQNIPALKNRVITRELFGQMRNIYLTFNPGKIMAFLPYLEFFVHDIEKIYNFVKIKDLPDNSKTVNYKLLNTVDLVRKYVDFLLHKTKAKYVGFDIETTNLNKTVGNNILTLQFATNTNEGVVIPLGHKDTPFTAPEQQEVKDLLYKLFTEKPAFKYWVTHNGKFEQIVISSIITKGKKFDNVPMLDTLAGMFLLNENRATMRGVGVGGFSLGNIAREFLNFDYGKLKAMRNNLNDYPLEEVAAYGALDAAKTLALFKIEEMYAKSQNYYTDWFKLLVYLYSPAFGTLAQMERNGFYIDKDTARYLKNKNSPLQHRMYEIMGELRTLPTVKEASEILRNNDVKVKPIWGTPNTFDLKHKDHLVTLFKDVMQLEVDYTDKGNYTVGKAFFEKYKDIQEVKLISEHAEMKKLFTSYAPKLVKIIDQSLSTEYDGMDSRVRPNFSITHVVTGRSASAEPNLQQIPRATSKERAMVKNLFRAQQNEDVLYKLNNKIPCTVDDGVRCLVQLDYMANEVRWWAIFAQDKELGEVLTNGKKLRDAYRNNPTPELKKKAKVEGDTHIQTASRMFNIPIDKVTDKERQPSKNIVFGWMYGRSTASIAQQLASSQWDQEKEDWETFVNKVQGYCDTFGKLYPQAEQWLYEIEKKAQTLGYAESLIGRRRRLDAYYISTDKKLMASANRKARNSPIQGNASDAALIGVSLLQNYINKYDKDWKIENAVHDSCIVEISVKELEEYVAVAEKIFTTQTMNYMTKIWGVKFICPLEVEFEISQAPTHGWATVTKWDFAPQELQLIKEGCLDPAKARAK